MISNFFRQMIIVARYELADAVRSKRAALTIILYVAGAIVAMNGFINVLKRLESQLVKTLGINIVDSAGVVTDSLWRSVHFRNMMIGLVGDKELAIDLLNIPPIALMYGWLAFTFTPMLVILTASPRIADEIATGSVRYVIQRCSRAAWSLGKFTGQVGLVILGLTLSAITAWTTVRFRLNVMDTWATSRAFIIFAAKAWIYSFTFVGLATGVSHLSRTANQATIFGFLAWFILSVINIAAKFNAGEGIRMIWYLVEIVLPEGHRMNLWSLDPLSVICASSFVITLGLCYWSAGYMYFRNRDL